MTIELSGEAPQNQKRSNTNNLEFKFPSRQYFFKDKPVVTIFHLQSKGNKLELPEDRRPDEVGCTNDPNYYLFHRMVHNPTNKFFLKDKIQALIDAGVLILKSEQKKVTANMVTLNFETFPKTTILDGVSLSLR